MPTNELGGMEGGEPRNDALLGKFENFHGRVSRLPGSVVAPGVEFFTLVMLEQLAKGSSKKELADLVGIQEWKAGGSSGFGKVGGWKHLHGVWKINSFAHPSEFGREVTQLYRTTILDRHSSLPNTKSREGGLELERAHWSKQSELVTSAEIAPKWEGGLKRAGGENGGDDILQTYIITAGYFEERGGGGWVVSIPLHGGGSFLISQNVIPASIVVEDRDVIVFIPEFRRASVYQWEDRVGKTSIIGQHSDYGGLCNGDESLRIDSWTIRTALTIEAHNASSLGKIGESPTPAGRKPPLVLRVKYPFFVQVKGPRGEILMEGEIKEENS